MEHLQRPIPEDEIGRIMALSEYNLDYATLRQSFTDLTIMAAKFAGTEISMINLLDTYNQWTVSKHGIAIDQMPREESVCQYTIAQNENFEVNDLSADLRFKDLDYVKGDLGLKYYYGIPITTASGHNLGALCVLDKEQKGVSPEKIELLQIIAREIVNRLNTFKQVEVLQQKITNLSDTRKMLAHDIRGPLSGILGLSQLATERFSDKIDVELLEYLGMITDSSKSTIDMAQDILQTELALLAQNTPGSHQYTLQLLREKLNDLLRPVALNKGQELIITITEDAGNIPFPKKRILQIISNLISNAAKFTPNKGGIIVDMALVKTEDNYDLNIRVSDTGEGMTDEQITTIMNGKGSTTTGSNNEPGYGLGLVLVKQIVESANGTMRIESAVSQGTTFRINLPRIMIA